MKLITDPQDARYWDLDQVGERARIKVTTDGIFTTVDHAKALAAEMDQAPWTRREELIHRSWTLVSKSWVGNRKPRFTRDPRTGELEVRFDPTRFLPQGDGQRAVWGEAGADELRVWKKQRAENLASQSKAQAAVVRYADERIERLEARPDLRTVLDVEIEFFGWQPIIIDDEDELDEDLDE